ncbi:hypothetical protein HU200_061961 [Digitaria exilis]|uniref:Bidirectional sugar transporter SWEET n=1 Tax=Digitaria exilis TaxID=1010633 RepID=A0A835ADV9_9POAL|nr:hypothetical protein HU200_061961 [Digitaria exilis]
MAGGLLHMAHPAITLSGVAGTDRRRCPAMHVVRSSLLRVSVATFSHAWDVYRKKSTGGFSSVPYVVALFSSVLWIFYALVKTNSRPLLTINAFGCGVEAAYIVFYLVYAPRKARLRTLAYFFLMDVAAFALIVAVTLFAVPKHAQVKFLGSVCLAFSMAVFVAPLSIIVKVVKTKSVEFLPISLSFCLTLSAVAWFCYGLFTKDPFVMMGLWFWYRKPRNTNAVLPTTGGASAVQVQGQVIELAANTIAILSVSPIPIVGVHKIEVVEQQLKDAAVAAEACRMAAANPDGPPPQVIEIIPAA